ncbi:hypothetical protein GN958_ATG13188 [Phytophthora infestans]|uniref:RxLR effector protein n=1 Tax=Phytophthora infestans TaxID=4787 RepID=A0A8S9UEC8_PHYIN|nr:hypothetical protein GN958_ATG13188 [Phytophthora infestans]
MRINLFNLLVAAAIVTSLFATIDAANVIEDHQEKFVPRHIQGNSKSNIIASEEEAERVIIPGLTKANSLLRTHPKHVDGMKNSDKQQALQAIRKMKSILGFSNGRPTKLTPEKMKKIETYARDNPQKWEAMAHYVGYAEWAAAGGYTAVLSALLIMGAVRAD